MTVVRLLDDVNHGSVEVVAQHLAACNASRRWIAEVLARRPYPNTDQLLATAERAVRGLGWEDVCEALRAHPRIGERAAGDSREAAWSRREQASVGDADDGT